VNLGPLESFSRRIVHPDDRGVPRQIGAMRELYGAPAQQDPRIERLMESAAAQIQSIMPAWAPIVVGATFPLVLLPLSFIARGVAPFWLVATLYFLVVGAAMMAWMRRRFRAIAPGLVATFVEEGLCAACGYNLHGVNPAEAHYICPECGAAWSAARVRRTAPIVTTTQEPLLREHARRGFRAYLNSLDRRPSKDDAGRLFTPVRLRGLRALRRSATAEHKSALAGAIRALRYKGLGRRLVLGGLLLGLAVLSAVPMLMSVVRVRTWMALLSVFPLLMMSLLAVAILASDMGRPARKVVAVLRSLGLCPCCAQPIRDLPPGDDGLVRCPTCLCAWKSGWNFEDATS
jgi:hypothetical protein